MFVTLIVQVLIDFIQFFLVFGLKLSNYRFVVMLVLHFGIFAISLQLINSLLEQSLLIFIIFLVLLFLLLKEIKLSSPKSFVFFKLGLNEALSKGELGIREEVEQWKIKYYEVERMYSDIQTEFEKDKALWAGKFDFLEK
jgi:hypothetical protein